MTSTYSDSKLAANAALYQTAMKYAHLFIQRGWYGAAKIVLTDAQKVADDMVRVFHTPDQLNEESAKWMDRADDAREMRKSCVKALSLRALSYDAMLDAKD